MRISSLAAIALPVALANALQITGPNADAFWVQNATNRITWTFSQGDPTTIDIVVVNANNATLNGQFTIASAVNVSAESFTVTNVTLRPGDNYAVQFVNTTNLNDVFTSSPNFTVKPPGSAPATTATPSASSSSSAASGSATAPGSSSSSASPTGASSSNGAMSLTSQGVFGVIAACGVASLSALLL